MEKHSYLIASSEQPIFWGYANPSRYSIMQQGYSTFCKFGCCKYWKREFGEIKLPCSDQGRIMLRWHWILVGNFFFLSFFFLRRAGWLQEINKLFLQDFFLFKSFKKILKMLRGTCPINFPLVGFERECCEIIDEILCF